MSIKSNAGLDAIFHPRSIAIVGATAGPDNIYTQMFLKSLLDFRFEGPIYPVNPKADSVMGLKTYPTVLDVPGPVDYAISLIPASATPQLMRECVAKGVRAVQLFTAGFDETGEQDRTRLQEDLAAMARRGGVRLLGPNCVGIYCPESRMSYASDFPKEVGRVGFIAQSGGYTYLTARIAAARGVRFSKMVSYGNASDINEIELLEYLANDPGTDVICVYIEGTRDGQRHLRVLAEATARKPVVVIKRGHTEGGRRGARSHTGALAGDDMMWDVAFRQAGVIRVEDVEELVDMMVTFLFFPLPRGRKVVLVGGGGGASVRAADQCEAGGLRLPPLPDDLREEVNRHIPLAGSMLTNPMDVLVEAHGGIPSWISILAALDCWEGADMFLWQVCPEMPPFREDIFSQLIIEVRTQMLEEYKALRKPKVVVVHAVETMFGLRELDAIRAKCADEGVAFYPSVLRAARAISRCMDYWDWRGRRAS